MMHSSDGIMTLSHQNILSYCEFPAQLLKIEHYILARGIKMGKSNMFHPKVIRSYYPHLLSSKKWSMIFDDKIF